MNKSPQPWIDEFKTFLEVAPESPSQELSAKINAEIHARLHPTLVQVLWRLALLHLAVSVITISFCPHFGVQLISGFDGVSGWFMQWGMQACMAGCGAFFMGAGLLASALLIPRDYIVALKRHALWQGTVLTFLSGTMLMALGQPIGILLFAFWVAGGVSAAALALWLGSQWRLAWVR